MRVCIVSSGRPQNVPKMHDQGWAGTWYVRPGEAHAYLDAGAEAVVEVEGLLVEARNRALEDAFAEDEPCVQVADDCSKVERWDGSLRIAAKPAELLAEAEAQLGPNCLLVGVAPTANSFYASTRVKRKHFICADFFVAAPSSLRFDDTFRVKEDYDYTAQHVAQYGEVARLDWWLLTFKHHSPGGTSAFRTTDDDDASIARLRAKWNGWFRPHPRREHEVLFVPR